MRYTRQKDEMVVPPMKVRGLNFSEVTKF